MTGPEGPPVNPFRFCPGCGREGIALNPDRSVQCGWCGFRFFFNAASAVAGLIEDDRGRLLLTMRGHDPKKGMYDLPGGFVDFAERAEDALVREIREELDLKVVRCSYFGSFPNTYTYEAITYHTVDLVFSCQVETLSGMKLSEEIERVEFFAPGDIPLSLIGFESIRNILHRYMHR